MAKVKSFPQIFSDEEWKTAMNETFESAEAGRSIAERLRSEAQRLINWSDKLSKDGQEASDKRLDQRLYTEKYWETETDKELNDMCEEIEKLLDVQKRVEEAHKATEKPLMVCNKSLENRMQRTGIELTHDELNIALMKEKEVIEGVRLIYAKTLQEIEDQIRKCRSAKYFLEKDFRDKKGAINIDTMARHLNMSNKRYDYSPAKPNSAPITSDVWEIFTRQNISDSEKQRHNAVHLRSIAESLCESTREDIRHQYNVVNAASRRRIKTIRDAKAKSEAQLKHMIEELTELRKTADDIKEAIEAKRKNLIVAETRLQERKNRPNVENCIDVATIALSSEIVQLRQCISQLQIHLQKIEDQIKATTRLQLLFEQDISSKVKSLEIDEEMGVPIRENLEFSSKRL